MHRGLTKAESAIIIQMRANKTGTRHQLAVFNVDEAGDGSCTHCRAGRETIRHILDECPTLFRVILIGSVSLNVAFLNQRLGVFKVAVNRIDGVINTIFLPYLFAQLARFREHTLVVRCYPNGFAKGVSRELLDVYSYAEIFNS